ncbi:phosphoribosylformylglycinamidine synthase [Aerococcaceae bacterium 50-4]
MQVITKNHAQFDVEVQKLTKEAVDFLQFSPDIEIRVYNLYHFENTSLETLEKIQGLLFDSQKVAFIDEIPDADYRFRYRQVTGQYNEHEQMLNEMIQHLLGFEEVNVFHSKVVTLNHVTQDQGKTFEDYVINPVENTVIGMNEPPFEIYPSSTEELDEIVGFTEMTEAALVDLAKNFSMDLDDLRFCQDYFKSENRNPNLTELKVIDTYWSDHCRHTTFNTQIDIVTIDAGQYEPLFKAALNDYLEKRAQLGRSERPITLMDLGTIQSRYLRENGLLDNVEISPEVNACALEIKVDVDGTEEDWILYFKNETHNHPTEIEPFGGASTCVGGGVRDPLSGRSWVYQGMRISGAKNPNLPLEATHPEKLPQRTISKRALAGNSDYANQIGLTGAFAEEIYHPGYEAKRLETGALISAAPRENIVRTEPVAGDKIILLGGRTGRDGLGAAVGSSQIQTEQSLENVGAEVQKGAAAVERKITRLFRKGEATRLIKRCNDFGAGGISVAVGELADGLAIALNEVPVKYPGMHGGEIALSESQERMAVVVADKDTQAFLAFCAQEDVEATIIADVTDNDRMQMTWSGKQVIDLSRAFLDSNGAGKHANATLLQPEVVFENDVKPGTNWNETNLKKYMSTLNRAGQKAMAEQFDGSIGRASVLFPFGGKYRATPELGMVSKLPVHGGKTKTTSGMAYGFDPYLSEQSPFHGGYYSVIESVSRMVALGFDYKDLRLTFQEFFENLQDDPKRWGKPVLSLLGANFAMSGLALASIGGKDSMSGTFEDIDVPPTLLSFAVAQGHIDEVVSRSFKQVGSQVVLVENPLNIDFTIDLDKEKKIYDRIHQLAKGDTLLAASTVGFNGMLKDLIEMSYGNGISLVVSDDLTSRLAEPMMGAFILELDRHPADLLAGIPYQVIGQTQADYIQIAGQDYSVKAIENASNEVFASVFDQMADVAHEVPEANGHATKVGSGNSKTARPVKALVPVLYGTNGEYDLQFALEDAGFDCQVMVIADSSREKFEQSIQDLIQNLKDTHLLALPNGSIFGNQTDEQGRAWELILNRPDMKQAIDAHLQANRLIVGNGSAFAALIRTGLIEFEQVTGQSAIRVLPNQNGKFMSDLYTGHVIGEKATFTSGQANTTYLAPLATAFGRIDLGEAAEKLTANNQVISVFETYFAAENIDALSSPNGLVFGSISSFERTGKDLYQNVPSQGENQFLRQAFAYLQAK